MNQQNTDAEYKEAARLMGRAGGKVRSEAKTKANRINCKKSKGRPKRK